LREWAKRREPTTQEQASVQEVTTQLRRCRFQHIDNGILNSGEDIVRGLKRLLLRVKDTFRLTAFEVSSPQFDSVDVRPEDTLFHGLGGVAADPQIALAANRGGYGAVDALSTDANRALGDGTI
jgi:hypothetical protein